MRRQLAVLLAALMLAGSLGAFQRGYQSIRRLFPDSDDDSIPAGAQEKTEFYFARLRYPNIRATGIWAMRGAWTVDYPKADRQFLQGVRRLTRIHANPMERVVDLISDDIFDYPFVYVVEPGHWDLPEAQVRKLREFIDRGGFLMTDDFHGTFEWEIFTASLNKAFADRPIGDIESNDPIFHVLYDLDDRVQVPGIVNYPFT
ncbi:MAG: DUF4159 domain-containing protein, partial [Bryobacteraceae bacterium]